MCPFRRRGSSNSKWEFREMIEEEWMGDGLSIHSRFSVLPAASLRPRKLWAGAKRTTSKWSSTTRLGQSRRRPVCNSIWPAPTFGVQRVSRAKPATVSDRCGARAARYRGSGYLLPHDQHGLGIEFEPRSRPRSTPFQMAELPPIYVGWMAR